MADKNYQLNFEMSDGTVKQVSFAVPQGNDGYTPIKGVDYYTDADKDEFFGYIATELAKRGQLKPEFAQTIEDCTDTSKLYVLPDGMIYAYMYTEVAVGGYTNMVDTTSDDFKSGYRYNASGVITTSSIEKNNCFVSNMFVIKSGDILRIKGVRASTSTTATAPVFVAARLTSDGSIYGTGSAQAIYIRQPLGATVTAGQQAYNTAVEDSNGVITWTYALADTGANRADDSATIVNTRIAGVATNGFENVIVTVNEEIREPEIVKQYQWASTGHAFVPADYEVRIVDLEAEDTAIREEIATAKAETAGAIADLQEQIDSGAASAKSGARWFALGDSITEGWASVVDTSQSNGYRQFLNTNVSQRWVNIVAEKNGYELTNHGIGGTGFLHTNGTALNARQLADTLDFSQCDFVTLAYGVNDWKNAVSIGSMDDDIATGGSMVANMRYVIQKVLTDNPYCKIFVITPINCRSYGDYNTNYGINYKGGTGGYLNSLGLQDIFDRMKEVCDYHGIELIDMTHCSIINRENIRTMLADYVHPTVECHAAMARELAKKINFA